MKHATCVMLVNRMLVIRSHFLRNVVSAFIVTAQTINAQLKTNRHWLANTRLTAIISPIHVLSSNVRLTTLCKHALLKCRMLKKAFAMTIKSNAHFVTKIIVILEQMKLQPLNQQRKQQLQSAQLQIIQPQSLSSIQLLKYQRRNHRMVLISFRAVTFCCVFL